jgi:hypothetical protein
VQTRSTPGTRIDLEVPEVDSHSIVAAVVEVLLQMLTVVVEDYVVGYCLVVGSPNALDSMTCYSRWILSAVVVAVGCLECLSCLSMLLLLLIHCHLLLLLIVTFVADCVEVGDVGYDDVDY